MLCALLPAAPAQVEPLIFEAERSDIARTSSGLPTTTVSDARARGGEWVRFDGPAIGDWLQLTLSNVPPGRYGIELTFRTREHMGKWRVEAAEADGTARTATPAGFDLNE